MYMKNEGGYTQAQAIEMNRTFPVLLELSTQRQLYPKMQFLKKTLGRRDPASLAYIIPPFYFRARLERILAPRHAFLVWAGLPSGQALFELKSQQSSKDPRLESQCLFQEFMMSCRNSKQFAAMCQSRREVRQRVGNRTELESFRVKITAKEIDAFDAIFSRGLLAAVRNDLVQQHVASGAVAWPEGRGCCTTADSARSQSLGQGSSWGHSLALGLWNWALGGSSTPLAVQLCLDNIEPRRSDALALGCGGYQHSGIRRWRTRRGVPEPVVAYQRRRQSAALARRSPRWRSSIGHRQRELLHTRRKLCAHVGRMGGLAGNCEVSCPKYCRYDRD